MFTERELAFIQSQRLLRLATVAADGQPDADAVGFVFDGAQFIIGGHKLAGSRKYRNVAGGNHKVSLILDDLASVEPWTPRGIKVHGIATAEQRVGQFGPGDYLVVRPVVTWSWGIEGETFKGGRFTPHKIIWQQLAEEER
jgi:pyridoxamine 5'-phosphate oxidase family protein